MQMRKISFRKVKQLAQSHIANKSHSLDLNPDRFFFSDPMILILRCCKLLKGLPNYRVKTFFVCSTMF